MKEKVTNEVAFSKPTCLNVVAISKIKVLRDVHIIFCRLLYYTAFSIASLLCRDSGTIFYKRF